MDKVTVVNNENPPIDVEITYYKNKVDLSFVQSLEALMAVHNNSNGAHANLFEQKVDKTAGKGLSTNDFNDDYKNQVTTTYAQVHTHSNKTILDNTTVSFTTTHVNQITSNTSAITTLNAAAVTSNAFAATLSNNIATTNATTTSSASNTRPVVVIQNYVNGTQWYRVYSDGWIEQGGYQYISIDSSAIVTLLKGYQMSNYIVFTQSYQTVSNDSYNNSCKVINKTNSTMTLQIRESGGYYGWYTCGY